MTWYCEKHRAMESAEEGTCEVAGVLWQLAPPVLDKATQDFVPTHCEIVERRLVAPNPSGYLVYGEYIPYDIFWKHTPFAAPVDQVIALYADSAALASQVGESE